MRSSLPRGVRWLALLGLAATLPLIGTGAALASSPAAPAGCSATTVPTVTQSTPVAIPTGPAVVTSTLDVAGAPTSLLDVDLTTFITHTFAADLEMTLMSPAGTVVTLTTDNGAGNDNVFNGTVWDDDANPAGQVPYTTNNGIVTDNAYVNLTLASPLTPEEPLAAFIGENPNGTWTLTVSDDLANEGGSIDSWSLDLTATGPRMLSPAGGTATVTAPVVIPTGPAVVSSTIDVAGASTIADLNLTTNIVHTFTADLDITLMSPAGTVVTLSTDNGAGTDDVFNGTVWDDGANPAGQVPYATNNGIATDNAYVNLTLASPLAPEEPLAAFIGEDPNGTWTLTISDDLAGDGGTVTWSMDIQTASCQADLATTVADSPDPAALGGNLTYGVTVANNGPSDAAATAVAFPLPASAMFVSATPSDADGSCVTPATGTTGTVNCSWSAPTAPGASRTVQVVATPTALGTISATATASTSTPDPNSANDAATAETLVLSSSVSEGGQPCTVLGTDGPDVLTGTDGIDVVCGLGGDDTITSVGSGDFVDAGAGNDTVTVASGAGVIFGGLGNDRLTGGADVDKLTGGAGDDVLVGGGGNDHLAGGLGNDRASGGAGNDIVGGGLGNDRLDGGLGDDRVTGGAGADRLLGVAGKDVVVGGLGNDLLDGGLGVDRLQGDAGNDRLLGGAANDRLSGGAGRDALVGGTGTDLVNGGSGIDTGFGLGDVFTAVEIQR